MNRILNYLKSVNISIPIPVGKLIGRIPFSYRPGIGVIYKEQSDFIRLFSEFEQKDKEKFIFDKFFKVFKHAYLNVPFYSSLYKNFGIELGDISCFSDISKIPVISKQDLIDVPLEERSFPIRNRMKVNTGGSSGRPLAFYMDPVRYGNEWAHIHYIWGKLGYRPNSIKLGFDGRSTVDNYVQYDFLRNTLRVDIYADQAEVCSRLYEISTKYNIDFLHGYPSAISEFASICKLSHPQLWSRLKSTLKGAFLNSEFPAPHYRENIEDTFEIKTQSFYGHTETCVFAEESERYKYLAHQTYGYAEVGNQFGYSGELVGTSYFNFASPLIRYNTQDLIKTLSFSGKILQKFEISDGRKGEYILDCEGAKIPLTGLIFGRHHKLFEVSSHVQVKQTAKGFADIFYVSKEKIARPEELFDSSNVKIQFNFLKVEKPILSISGKINLLIK
ncbi:hypothetical protein [Sphingobacterium sp. JB170]|uniref:hypothetical protein n=1 Tax=Sphingobacterium sp. JB170 TaxID=1434842 RepID=UPI00097ED7E7|nr:hypothetical protein [Sphingobacterium sp. JB170]SJN28754.1 CapK protein, putative [Sphingobacterium sp. JB170]